jgi:biopolymer transport protein TolR
MPTIPKLEDSGGDRPARPARRTMGVHPNYLDVMCCLVLVFMLTSLLASSAARDGLEKNLPPIALPEMSDAKNPNPAEAPSALVLTVKPGPQYFVESRALTLDELSRELNNSRAKEVEIRGDEAVPYGAVMAAIRICRAAGISQVALAYKVQE